MAIKQASATVKPGDGRVAQLLVALLNKQIDVAVDTGDLVLNTDDLENLLQGINGATETFTPSVNANTSGTVAAGAFSVTFHNSGTISCTVAGVSIPAGHIWEATSKVGNTLGAIAWSSVGAGGELTILETR